jgi:arylsulfatase A-like enzyme
MIQRVLAAALVGLLSAELELGVRAARAAKVGAMLVPIPVDAWWMVPAVYVVGFGLLGVALAAAVARLSAARAWAVIAGITATAGFLGSLLMFGQLDERASLVLAAGLGVVVGRWAAPRWRTIEARVVPMFGAVTLLVAGVAAGAQAYRSVAEHRAGRLVGQAATDAPNVLLLILDTVRAQSLSLYGYGRKTTPVLDSLSESAMVFDQAWAAAPWTAPSHASMFTGRYADELSIDFFSSLDKRYPTIAEVMRDRGWETAAFVSNHYMASAASGLARGFVTYRDSPVTLGRALQISNLTARLSRSGRVRRLLGYYDALDRARAGELQGRFLQWLDTREDARHPFFAFLNYMDAHEPYLPSAPYSGQFGPDSLRKNWMIEHTVRSPGARRNKEEMTEEERGAEQAAYESSIAELDAALGRLLGELRVRNLIDNTVIVVAADHGEQLGEHGEFDHGNTLYRQLLHVPLMLVVPGSRAHGRVSQPVSLRDLPATILDAAGVKEHPIPGASLVDAWQGPVAASPIIASFTPARRIAPPRYFSLVSDGLHLLEQQGDSLSVFDLTDAGEERDLMKVDSLSVRRESWRALIAHTRNVQTADQHVARSEQPPPVPR